MIVMFHLIPDFIPIPDNFQDQMKRELAYREEMVQQLQMVRILMWIVDTDGSCKLQIAHFIIIK